MKNNKGITLIALVITIIVLLILVGVTLAMISGESSIFTKAQTASEKTMASQARELSGLLVSELITDWYDGKFVSNISDIKAFTTAGAYVKDKLIDTVSANGQGIIKAEENAASEGSYPQGTYPLKITARTLTEEQLVGYVNGTDGKITWAGTLAADWKY